MRTVAVALAPAVCAAVYERGAGALAQVLLAVLGCAAAEAACLRLRGKPPGALADGSAAVAGIIIGLSLPPLAPWHVALAAAAFAMAPAKHCYGGLGNNPFNPAMAGYALAFVSFPADFGNWGGAPWTAVFFPADAQSTPTPLLAARLGAEPPPPSYWFPAACALGGAALLLSRAADWRLAAAFGGGVLLAGGGAADLAAGGMMLAAFFVITDPVTAAETPGGRILYGAAAGALAVTLRRHGLHADGIAFAVLFCNMLSAPFDRAAKALWRT